MIEQINESLFTKAADIINLSRSNAYRSVNITSLIQNWLLGSIIVEEEQNGKQRATYGEFVIKQLSEKLTLQFGKGFDNTNLKLFRKFYIEFPALDFLGLNGDTMRNLFPGYSSKQIGDTACNLLLRTELSWSHYRLLMRVEDLKARQYYIHEVANQQWNVRQLERQINTFYYEHLVASQDKNAVEKESAENSKELATQTSEHVKDPYILEFLGLKPEIKHLEKDLEQAIINNLQHFLLELGKGFAFVDRQHHIVTDTKDFYIDLVFYNYMLKCFVIIDLKIGELSHQDIGQMDMYVRMFDTYRKGKDDNPTVGIILCSEKDEAIVKFSVINDNEQLFASKYKLYLPTADELTTELKREIQLLKESKQ